MRDGRTTRRFAAALRTRRVAPERMDDPALDAAEHECALRGLARLNALGGAARMLWRVLRRELPRAESPHPESPRAGAAPLTVLDVACGSGDVLAALVRRARGRLVGVGLDVSPVAVARATAAAPPGIAFRTHDVLDPTAPLPPCDIALCSLFFHHLAEEQAASLLARMAAAARRLVVVSDLERSPRAWWLVWAGARLVTRSPVVHHDSDLSVRAAWTIGELRALARRAGLEGVTVRRAHPARLLMVARVERMCTAPASTSCRNESP